MAKPGLALPKDAQKRWSVSIARRTRELTDSCMVAFSGGKDALVTLDICHKTFNRVEAFFMYLVPGLEFQEEYLRVIERRYGISINRTPHWALGRMLESSYYRWHTKQGVLSDHTVKLTDVENAQRKRTGVSWIAHGMRSTDSLQRRAMISQCRGIDIKARRFYPIASYSQRAVFSHIKHNKIPLPTEYRWGLKSSLALDSGDELLLLKKHSPGDYKKVLERFPFLGVLAEREAMYGKGD